jgi:tRNA U34 5-methylaminomethyl-2-thiouridine-forming methyltransferase MnmC
MKSIKTKDDSITFFNEEFDEYYHSLGGAIEEAFEKYVKPLEVKDGDVILDVCFGLGYNTYAALKSAKKLKIIALENDPKVLEAMQKITIDSEYEMVKKAAKDKYYKDENYKIIVLLGDAKKTIHKVSNKVDLVFFDPFSPKKCPSLWTVEFFREIYKVMKKNSKLATYSCARSVRDNLKEAGFKVIDGPTIKRRGPSTIAIKNKEL